MTSHRVCKEHPGLPDSEMTGQFQLILITGENVGSFVV